MNTKQFMNLPVMSKCMDYCVNAHSETYRKFTEKEPYSNHPIRVCHRVVDLLLDPKQDNNILEGVITAAISALFHDILEDTDIQERSLLSSLTGILTSCGYSNTHSFNMVYDVQQNLRILTKRKNENYDAKLSGADYIQTLVKLCDIEDNINHIDSAFKENYIWALKYCHKKLAQLERMLSYKWRSTTTLANNLIDKIENTIQKHNPKKLASLTITNERGAHLKTFTGIEETHIGLILKLLSGGELYGFVDTSEGRKRIFKNMNIYVI